MIDNEPLLLDNDFKIKEDNSKYNKYKIKNDAYSESYFISKLFFGWTYKILKVIYVYIN